MTYILDSDRTIVTGGFNAHHHMWYSPMTDHRGTLIADKINNSDHLTLNTDSHTRHPTNRNQQPTSPDISTATNTINTQQHNLDDTRRYQFRPQTNSNSIQD